MTLPKSVSNALECEIDPAFEARARFIFEAVSKHSPRRILDAGCGRGFYLAACAAFDFVEVVEGIDASVEFVEAARSAAQSSKVSVRLGNLEALPYPDGSFDCVICSEVLEHLSDDRRGLSEIRRVLRPGGVLLASVPNENFPFLWDPANWLLMKLFGTHLPKNIHWLAGIWADHERLYSEASLRSILSSEFSEIEIRSVLSWCWPFSHFILYGIGKNLVRFFGMREFDRFRFGEAKPLARIVSRFMSLPSAFERSSVRGVNLVSHARKTSIDGA